MCFDVIIVGSGIAGTAAAYQLRGKKVAVLDVGHQPTAWPRLQGDQHELRRTNESLFEELIGKDFESLHNVTNTYLSPKLKSPGMAYIIKEWRKLSPIISSSFTPEMSFAMGGLANAWGGGLFRYSPEELADFPINIGDLNPYYDKLTKLIGICGTTDDLTPFLGSTKGLQSPLTMSTIARTFLTRYEKKRNYFSSRGIHVGRPRLGVLTEDLGKRKKCSYENLEFFKPHIDSIYTPAFTLQEMIDAGEVTYLTPYLVDSFSEDRGKVSVRARNLASNCTETLTARKLILCAGTLNTTKIVLKSANDTQTRLPILDNPISYVPLLSPAMIGFPSAEKAFSGGQLNIIYHGDRFTHPIFITLYSLTGPLRSEFLHDFPLANMGCLTAIKHLLPSLLITQLFYPDEANPNNSISLKESGELAIDYSRHPLGSLETFFISSFRKIGFWGFPSLCQYPLPGNSFHYAGTLPMREKPKKPYETDRLGRLHGKKLVHIGDPATFPILPSKHLSFTNMANAMRIGQGVKEELDAQ